MLLKLESDFLYDLRAAVEKVDVVSSVVCPSYFRYRERKKLNCRRNDSSVPAFRLVYLRFRRYFWRAIFVAFGVEGIESPVALAIPIVQLLEKMTKVIVAFYAALADAFFVLHLHFRETVIHAHYCRRVVGV